MKAEYTRKAIHILIATSEFPLPEFGAKKVDEELKELERLAEIGRAAEKAYNDNYIAWDMESLLNWYKED